MQETRVRSLGGKISWRWKWQSTPIFMPGKSHGQRSLWGYSSWGWKELDVTEHTCTCARMCTHTNTPVRTRAHTPVHTCTHTPVHTHTHQCICTHTHQWTHTHTPVQDCGIRNTHPEITQLFIPKSSCTGPRDQGSCPSLYSQSLGHEKDSVSQSDTREKGGLWLAQAE